MRTPALILALGLATGAVAAQPEFGGIYPHLAYFNNEGECGTGAVVPWAGKLWIITYAPHQPKGSSDKLYEISPDLHLTVRPESIGGTPANRMIHRESQQLFIGPYAIDATGGVRVITYSNMYGRHTGNARHLTDPANKIYYATMEEGIYEVDVKTLAPTQLWADEQLKTGRHAALPGYHGKGFYSSQGRMVYANNGDHAREALSDPTTPSGVLAEWDGKADQWTIVRRNQFTEVTGPGGIEGNAKADDPIWSIGWDHRSLILMLLDGGQWQAFRLPKASHSYDGAHGWNTEWPRIRDIGEQELLMTMHGTFWRFPRTFSAANSAGIAPRSTYLKVIGDFCRWNDRLVFGCDDSAKSEFLNKRKVKGQLAGPGQSQSNIWFTDPERLDLLGPTLGSGAVWLRDPVKAGALSDSFLFSGYARRGLFLAHGESAPVTFTLSLGDGQGGWKKLRDVTVEQSTWIGFEAGETAPWIALRTDRDVASATAVFHYASEDKRPTAASALFAGLATPDAKDYSGALLRARGENKRTLAVVGTAVKDGQAGASAYYELDEAMQLKKIDDAAALAFTEKSAAIPVGVISADAASVLVVDNGGRRWRLPKNDAQYGQDGALPLRVCREICTERDLFQAHGAFYELPAENAGGFAKMRPVCTHNRRIVDYCSFRGLLLLAGVAADAPASNPRVVRSDDGKVALWAGAVDELWQLGKPVGRGGPWADTDVKAGVPSDPYLFRGYDKKTIALSHDAKDAVTLRVEVDVTGSGDWMPAHTATVKPGEKAEHVFPAAYCAHWVRVVADRDCKATAQLAYE